MCIDHQTLAKRLDEAASDAEPVAQLSNDVSMDLNDAYAIQKALIDFRTNRGEDIVGVKMGFTSEAKMKQMGVHDMIWGRLTSDMRIEDGGELRLSRYIHPRSEPEICFRVSKTISQEVSLEQLEDYVDGMAAAIEIIDSRFENFKFSLDDVVADNCSSTGFVIGPWLPVDRAIDDLSMRMYFNDEEVASGTSKDILGDPWKALQAATRLVTSYGHTIKPGQVIFAGAATAAEFLKPETTVKVSVERLGEVSFQVK